MADENSQEREGLTQQIQAMGVSEKIDLALKGSKEARGILLRDPNRVIQMAVISSPKLTDAEVMMIANNREINDEVLRYIAAKKEWMRIYPVKAALVSNPKTPLGIAMKLLPYLNIRDLSALAKSKSIPGALAAAAAGRLKELKR
jgi:hypothetical protein